MDASLVELLRDEYALAIVMPTKKDIFGNWIKHHMCGDYHPMNKWIHPYKYVMPLPKKIFYALWTC
jgi:hypothetical protein